MQRVGGVIIEFAVPETLNASFISLSPISKDPKMELRQFIIVLSILCSISNAKIDKVPYKKKFNKDEDNENQSKHVRLLNGKSSICILTFTSFTEKLEPFKKINL